MSLAFELTMGPRLGLEVTPALVAFGELLVLPCAEVRDLIEDEVSANDALERQEMRECPVCRGSWARCPVCCRSGGGAGPVRDGPPSELPAVEPDSEVLRRQVHAETATADAALVDYLVDSLDRHGLLDRGPAELAAEAGTTEEHLTELLGVVRRCGPPGVGATGIAECLLLQLDALRLPDDRMLRAIVTDHLHALARGHFAVIAEALGVGRDEIRRLLGVIRARLRPYPAFDGSGPVTAPAVVPDVVIAADPAAPGGYRVELVEPATNPLRVRPGPGAAAARVFLGQLRDRWATLRRIAECVADRQRDFLARGPAGLRPLTRCEVAADLGLHESTVSRAVAEKYVLLPDRTTVPMSGFFSTGGGADDALRRLLESEQRCSDQRLAELLGAAGYPMARRTVAKHRARLGFTAAALR